MSANGRGAGRGAGAAGVEESPAGRSLGLIVPRRGLLVVTLDGPLAGQVIAQTTWNRKVVMSRRHWEDHGRLSPLLGYEEAHDVELFPLRYSPPLRDVR